MFIITAILLSIAALLIVAYPILAKSGEVQPSLSVAHEQLDELLVRRDAAFQALRDLSFDHRVGKVTDEDFAVFEANLKDVAAEALAEVDRWETGTDANLEAVLEQAIASRRTAPVGGRECPNCRRAAAADDKFCASCGASLPPPPGPTTPAPVAGGTCPACGRAVEPNDRFCASCGSPLTQRA
jgi:rRNA maturation endonuclease Nob1